MKTTIFEVQQISVGGFDHNFSYLIYHRPSQIAAVVDPAGDYAKIKAAIDAYGDALDLKYVLLTHSHADHYSALAQLQADFDLTVCGGGEKIGHGKFHRLEDREKIVFQAGKDDYIEVIATLGHSDDSVCYYLGDGSALFTGDTLFIGCCGYCDGAKMYNSLQNIIMNLNDEIIIFPGHDYGERPFDTLKAEKENNIYLKKQTLNEFKENLKLL